MRKCRFVKDRCCLNADCPAHGKFSRGNIRVHSFYTTRQGRRRRYLCVTCGVTFSSTAGTPYYRLKKSRATFDEVAEMAVEGIGVSSTARIKQCAPNTVAHWRELAATYASRFNDNMLNDFELTELQADEIRTYVHSKSNEVWIMTLLEVSARLWVSCLVGRRTFEKVKAVIASALCRGQYSQRILFTSDGLRSYAWAAKTLLAGLCVYAQVIKTRCKDRVVRVERKLLLGTQEQLEDALFNSEDSSTINTSFVERHNLTIRQGSSYLGRRTACHAREQEYLSDNMTLMMCFYNFMRPHSALRFGNETRTPAMQAGLVSKRLNFRDVFTSRVIFFLCLIFLAVTQRGNAPYRVKSGPLITVT